MIESIIAFIQTFFLPLGAVGVFIASFVEEVVAPIPSALVIFSSGFLYISGPITWATVFRLMWLVVVPAAAGVTVGSLVIYGVAYYAGKPMLEKWGKWLGLSWSDIERLQEKFSRSSFDEFGLFVARAIPAIPSVAIAAFCGLIRFKVWPFIIYSFLGLLVRVTILGFIGWQVGALYFKYANIVSLFENLIFVVIGLMVVGFVVWRMLRKPKENSMTTLSSADKTDVV